VIALSTYRDEGYRDTRHQVGASCFVSKDSAFEDLIRAIEAVVANASG
jgi:DNA-binding NarL/FixJ family response regulator